MDIATTAEPLTVVVRRRIKPGKESEFEAAMHEFIGFALSFPGHLDVHVLRPPASEPRDYTVVDRFADRAARQAFKESAAYQEWMKKLRGLSESDPVIEEQGGLAGWFTLPKRELSKPPTRPKMAAVTFLGVYPLTSVLPRFVAGQLPGWHPLLVNVIVTALVVSALTWVVMPWLTRLFAPWLFSKSE